MTPGIMAEYKDGFKHSCRVLDKIALEDRRQNLLFVAFICAKRPISDTDKEEILDFTFKQFCLRSLDLAALMESKNISVLKVDSYSSHSKTFRNSHII